MNSFNPVEPLKISIEKNTSVEQKGQKKKLAEPQNQRHDAGSGAHFVDGSDGGEAAARGEAPGLVYLETSDVSVDGIKKDASPGLVVMHRDKARFSRMKKSIRAAASLLDEQARQGGFMPDIWMITLTYEPDIEWSSKHITHFTKSYREYFNRRGVQFLSARVMELHKSGVPHYHVVIWLPKGTWLPMADKRGWWPYGMSNQIKVEKPVGYLIKYASKGTGGLSFPKGARIHGNTGLDYQRRLERAWCMLPAWVREVVVETDRAIRAPGGGWLVRSTGEYLPSLYEFVGHAPDWSWCAFRKKTDQAINSFCQ